MDLRPLTLSRTAPQPQLEFGNVRELQVHHGTDGSGHRRTPAHETRTETNDLQHKSISSCSILFVTFVSVSEAADLIGVSVPRIHQRIADGSLRAQRIGAQWVIDELSLLRIAERHRPGRPLSTRSAWAIIATSLDNQPALTGLAHAERLRARARWNGLLESASRCSATEDDVRHLSTTLRSVFRNRASRLQRTAAVADLSRLRQDHRWQALVSPAQTGIASATVEGYLSADDLDPISREYLLVPVDTDANVVIHVLPAGQHPYPTSTLRLAADLADHRSPREELRAAELLRGLVAENLTDR